MAVNFTTLFDRIGKAGWLFGLVNEIRGAAGYGAIATDLPTEWEDFVEQYDGANDTIRGTVAGMHTVLTNARGGLQRLQTDLATACTSTIVEMMHADTPLSSKTISVAMALLISQMVTGTKTVDANTVGLSSALGGSNNGTGVIVTSTKTALGKTAEYMIGEVIRGTVITATTAGSEKWTLLGETTAERLGWEWPKGSGSTQTYTAIDASANSNLLTNGDLEAFTANAPDNWSIVVGVAGTDITQTSSAGTFYAGAKALKLVGDGSTLSQIRQAVTGLKSKTPYAVNFWAKNAANPAAGVLTIDLYDGSAVINDEAGTANSFTVDLTTLGTTFVAKNGVFRLPEPVPATVYLRVRVSTAIENTKITYIDHLALGKMGLQYAGGPYIAFFSGATAWSLDDTVTVTPTNDYGGLVQTLFWRLFDMPSLGLMLPSDAAGAENIADSVIA